MLELVLPELRWRLVKLILPIKELLYDLVPRIHAEARGKGLPQEIPFMWEFLNLACRDRTALEEEDWP